MVNLSKGCLGILCIILLFGCTNKNLYFGTHTQIGLDVSGTASVPNEVSFAFGRSEVAIVPKKSDDTAHSVYGGLDSDITWFSGQMIRQLFATGCAAQSVASRSAINAPAPSENTNDSSTGQNQQTNGSACKDRVDPDDVRIESSNAQSRNSSSSLILIVKSKFGLDINFGQENVTPELVLGYKRSELTIIPVDNPDREVRSVYADISINSYTDPNSINPATSAPSGGGGSPTDSGGGSSNNNPESGVGGDSAQPLPSPPPSRIGGVRIVQQIATGEAAKAIVKNKTIQKKLTEAVGGDVQNLDDALTCLEQQGIVIENLEELNANEAQWQRFQIWSRGEFGVDIDSVGDFEEDVLASGDCNQNRLQRILGQIEVIRAGGDS